MQQGKRFTTLKHKRHILLREDVDDGDAIELPSSYVVKIEVYVT